MSTVRILASADFHLGRLFAFPYGIDAEELSLKSSFKRFVDFALLKQNDIHAVVLAGDIVDGERDLLRAFSLLESGLAKLLKGGIAVVAICGNHDFLVLKKLKELLPFSNFHLLGLGGKWESRALTLNDEKVRFDGFSFSTAHYDKNPFESYALDEVKEELALGVLHCDLNQQKSPYAPVSLLDFKRKKHKAWILGHQHECVKFCDDPLIFYTGSPMPLDHTEIGAHGAVLLSISASSVAMQKVLDAPLEYRDIRIDLDGVKKEHFHEKVVKELAKFKRAAVYSIKLRLDGRCLFYSELEMMAQELKTEVFELDGRKAFINGIENLARGEFEIDELCKGSDPLSMMAGYLKKLDDEKIFKERSSAMRKLLAKDKYLKEELAAVTDEELKAVLLKSGFCILEEMVRG